MKRGKKLCKTTWLSLPVAFMAACSDRDEVVITPAAEIQTIEVPRSIPPPVIPRSRASALASDDILPGAGEVRASLTRGDYDAAVEALLALRSGSTEGRKYTEYLAIQSEVMDTLKVRARSEPKAAQSLARLIQPTHSQHAEPRSQ